MKRKVPGGRRAAAVHSAHKHQPASKQAKGSYSPRHTELNKTEKEPALAKRAPAPAPYTARPKRAGSRRLPLTAPRWLAAKATRPSALLISTGSLSGIPGKSATDTATAPPGSCPFPPRLQYGYPAAGRGFWPRRFRITDSPVSSLQRAPQ